MSYFSSMQSNLNLTEESNYCPVRFSLIVNKNYTVLRVHKWFLASTRDYQAHTELQHSIHLTQLFYVFTYWYTFYDCECDIRTQYFTLEQITIRLNTGCTYKEKKSTYSHIIRYFPSHLTMRQGYFPASSLNRFIMRLAFP